LTILIAHVCGIGVGELILTLGDAHVYCDHIEPVKQQVQRVPKPFPALNIKKPRGGGLAALESFTFDDMELVDYSPHPTIKMKMSV
jgi:thymidylate synthase